MKRKLPNNQIEYKLTLRAGRHSVPADVRMKAALKLFLRAFNFRCTRLARSPPDDIPQRTTSNAAKKLKLTQRKPKMPKIGKLFPSKFLRAEDLDGDVVLTIRKITIEAIGNDREEKPVISFRETEKLLALNKTNARSISEVADSDETDDWIGKQVILYPTKVQFRADLVPAIRIRESHERDIADEVRAVRKAAVAQEAAGKTDNIPF